MCGIIAIVRRKATRTTPSSEDISAAFPSFDAVLPDTVAELEVLAREFEDLNALLSGVPGVMALVNAPETFTLLAELVNLAENTIAELDESLDEKATAVELESTNAAVLRLKDAIWSVGRDRLRTARAVNDLCRGVVTTGTVEAYLSVQEALSAIDRLEVRGRDSAGLHLLVSGHGLDLADPAITNEIEERSADPLFGSGSVRVANGHLSFVYKAAAEIGELGDNTAVLRDAIRSDKLLRRSLSNDMASVVVLGHTRWASVGIISEPNAHPLNSEQLNGDPCSYVTAALNGDIDNFADLCITETLTIPSPISTDAKIIPTLIGRHLGAASELPEFNGTDESFRRTVAALEGSVAIAASAAITPDRLHLALRGSGQGLYVGFAEDAYVVASEPYGLVEITRHYLRMEGDTPGNLINPTASRGQIVTLDGSLAGDVAGLRRFAYDGTEIEVTHADLLEAEITTRDIDRGAFPHYLLKEITEAPRSVRKTLRGKLADVAGELRVDLGIDTLPAQVREHLASGVIRNVLVIGQGTAAVAGQSLALMLKREGAGRLQVNAMPATELSGFHLRSDMADTLVVAISQSGTTTDTNRTVDLVRSRRAYVISVVNRRNSDLTDKSDGVLYTSDGRDVEMSVASTKAFYAQIVAGALLAAAIADYLPQLQSNELTQELDRNRQSLLSSLRQLPLAMEAVLQQRGAIRKAAAQYGPPRRYWAIVGNGPNVVAAREIRIKLSELCYKSIAADLTEDKKHIDLSCEPLILVCATGLTESTASDVAKEVAIYRAHKAAPIVIADEGVPFPAAEVVISVPAMDPALSFVLSTVVGHLFGYEAALAIDAQARPLRETRAALERAVAEQPELNGETVLQQLRPKIAADALKFLDGLRAGDYDGHLEASNATLIAALYRYANDTIPLDSYQLDFGKVGTPTTILEDLVAALTVGIADLTRPVDAIKHQAKTVTVGISRSDEEYVEVSLVKKLLDAGTPRDRLTYNNLRTLASLDPAIVGVLGYTRYQLEGSVVSDSVELVITGRGGVAREMSSRVDRDPALRGSKHLVAVERQIYITKGRSDGRLIMIVPEVKDKQTVGINLLHVKFADFLPPLVARGVLQGYRNRYSGLRDFVTETEPTFREDLFATVPVSDLLIQPVSALAELWTKSFE